MASSQAARITLRPAEAHDCYFFWHVRNEPDARARSFRAEPIPWPGHQRWFEEALRSAGMALFVAEVDATPAGYVRFTQLADGRWEASVALLPAWRGQGWGSRSLSLAGRQLLDRAGPCRLVARIRSGHEASARAFEKAGYRPVGRMDVVGAPAMTYELELVPPSAPAVAGALTDAERGGPR